MTSCDRARVNGDEHIQAFGGAFKRGFFEGSNMFASRLSRLRSSLLVPELLFPKLIECCDMMADRAGSINLCTGPNKIPESRLPEIDKCTNAGCCDAPGGQLDSLRASVDLIVAVASVAMLRNHNII